MATKKIRYVGPLEAVVIEETQDVVQRNHQVEVDEDLAKRLLEQEGVWERVTEKRGK